MDASRTGSPADDAGLSRRCGTRVRLWSCWRGTDTHVGSFAEALMGEAKKDGWVVINMQKDWKRLFSFDK